MKKPKTPNPRKYKLAAGLKLDTKADPKDIFYDSEERMWCIIVRDHDYGPHIEHVTRQLGFADQMRLQYGIEPGEDMVKWYETVRGFFRV